MQKKTEKKNKRNNSDLFYYYPTPIGQLALVFQNNGLHSIQLEASGIPNKPSDNLTCKKIVSVLDNYFQNKSPINHIEKLPIQLTGTSFQRKVWQALCKIPFGQTKTYGELAELLNTSARAVGNACRANPVPIIIPCHRVLSKTGIGGFSGKTTGQKIKIKHWLLQHEQ